MTHYLTLLFLASTSVYAVQNDEPTTGINLSSLHSNGNEGAGGFGISEGEGENEQVFLLDLVERGVEKTATVNPQIKEGMPFFDELRNRIVKKLDGLVDERVIDIVTYKIVEVSRVAPFIAFQLLAVLEQLDWVLINSPLERLLGISSPLVLDDNTVLIANRLNRIVRVHSHTVKKMDYINQAALILHEITSPLLTVTFETRKIDDTNKVIGIQNWAAGRDFVGAIFAPYKSKEELYSRIVKLSKDLKQPNGTSARRVESQIDAYNVKLSLDQQSGFKVYEGVGFQQYFSVEYLYLGSKSIRLANTHFSLILSLDTFLHNRINQRSEKTYSDDLCSWVRTGLFSQKLSKDSIVDINLMSRTHPFIWDSYSSLHWGNISYVAPGVKNEDQLGISWETEVLKERVIKNYDAGKCHSDPNYAHEALKKAFDEWAKPVFEKSLFRY